MARTNLDEAHRMVKMNITLQRLHQVDFDLKEVGGSKANKFIQKAIGQLQDELDMAIEKWWLECALS